MPRGFPAAAAVVAAVMFLVVAAMSRSVFSRTPGSLGQAVDGGAGRQGGDGSAGPHGADGGAVPREKAGAAIQPGEPAFRSPAAELACRASSLWRDRAFQTLAAGMAMGLFAQIGLLAHLFTQLAPVLGAQAAGVLMGGCCGLRHPGARRGRTYGQSDRRQTPRGGGKLRGAGGGRRPPAGRLGRPGMADRVGRGAIRHGDR